MSSRFTKQKGFTILELLIVIAIIGILAAIVLNTFPAALARARDSDRKADIGAIQTQLEVYKNDHGSYPAPADLVDGTWLAANMDGLDSEALNDPDGNQLNATDSDYGYTSVTNCESPTDDTGADVTITTECSTYTLTATLEEEADLSETNL